MPIALVLIDALSRWCLLAASASRSTLCPPPRTRGSIRGRGCVTRSRVSAGSIAPNSVRRDAPKSPQPPGHDPRGGQESERARLGNLNLVEGNTAGEARKIVAG